MSSSTTASKKALYASLYDQLDQLDKNITRLSSNVNGINEQAPVLRKIGILHTAMSMSSAKVLNETHDSERSQQQQQQQQ